MTRSINVILTKRELLSLMAGHELDGIDHNGDPAALTKLMELLVTPNEAFAVATP